MDAVLFLLLLFCYFGQLQVFAQFRPEEWIEGLSDASNTVTDFISSMIWPKCDFRPDIAETVKLRLHKIIKGQNEGGDMIINSLRAWEFQRTLGVHQPLVLAITGPTGVGKTETSYQIAHALFPTHKYGNTVKPCGYLSLRGEDYSNSSDLYATGINNMQRVIRQRIAAHLAKTNGNAVILVDEIQKIQPGVMEVFVPMLDPRGSLTFVDYVEPDTYANKAKSLWNMFKSTTGIATDAQKSTQRNAKKVCESGEDDSDQGNCDASDMDTPVDLSKPMLDGLVQVTKEISTQNVIFIFVSDIGVDTMIKLLLKYGDRQNIPIPKLRSDIKHVLDEQWDRLVLGKTVKEIVPYLPLEEIHVRDILASKLEVGDKLAIQKKLWLKMVTDNDVIDSLSGPRFIDYEQFSLGGSQKLFATRGARALENAGPLHDLQGMIGKFMSPWRPTEIFHVGLITDRNLERTKKAWKNTNQQKKSINMFFQWCVPDPCLFTHSNITDIVPHDEENDEIPIINRIVKYSDPTKCATFFASSHQSSSSGNALTENRPMMAREFIKLMEENGKDVTMTISDDYSFSSLCETIWFGKFPAV